MLSHIKEYQCQYTEDVRKKNKVWHDGLLKYFEANSRFQLFTEESHTLIGTEFVVNQKDVLNFLNEEGFDETEHRIFRRYLVVISTLTDEYDRDVAIAAQTTSANAPNVNMKSSQTVKKNSRNSINTSVACAPAKTKITPIHSLNAPKIQTTSVTAVKTLRTNGSGIVKSVAKKSTDMNANSFTSSLALKMNKPFKKPRLIRDVSQIAPIKAPNRPNIRTQAVKVEASTIATKLEPPALVKPKEPFFVTDPHIGTAKQVGYSFDKPKKLFKPIETKPNTQLPISVNKQVDKQHTSNNLDVNSKLHVTKTSKKFERISNSGSSKIRRIDHKPIII